MRAKKSTPIKRIGIKKRKLLSNKFLNTQFLHFHLCRLNRLESKVKKRDKKHSKKVLDQLLRACFKFFSRNALSLMLSTINNFFILKLSLYFIINHQASGKKVKWKNNKEFNKSGTR